MTTPTTKAAELPEALRLADLLLALQTHLGPRRCEKDPDEQAAWDGYTDAAAELRRLYAYCQELESQVIVDCMTHGAGAQVEALSAAQAGVPADDAILVAARNWGDVQPYLSTNGSGEQLYRVTFHVHQRAAHFAKELLAAAPQPSPPPASTDQQLDDALRDRDQAVDYIDTLLDEVLGADRPEWSSAYGWAEALIDVQERITTLAAAKLARTAPPLQAMREPLTDVQIRELRRKHPSEDLCAWSYNMGVIDAEQHHGITKGGQHG